MTENTNTQKAHFEALHARYEAHYYDKWSMKYRNEFIYGPLWGDLDLNGLRIAELACGSGHNTLSILAKAPQAQVVGFDISAAACQDYAANTGMPAYEADITLPWQGETGFDVVFIVGGLHHCVRDLRQALENVGRILKPGGLFLMQEPNACFFLESARQLWYRKDGLFDAGNEAALDMDELARIGEPWFKPQRVKYSGGPAYFVVLQSMILRVPLGVKNLISAPLIVLERLWDRLPGKHFHNTFIARWERL
ncbi:MAG: class I SAM-dependent methyltransferase [Alphaproteobacteria bacterium]|nr:class I SAM-dependent methyltransferase [Alphaproteobacteria bacterium]